jgi:hypothetical protein
VAKSHRCRRENVSKLYKQFCEDGDVLVFGKSKGPQAKRGAKPEVHRKLQRCHLKSITRLVDDFHREGRTVTNKQVRLHLHYEFGINVSKMTISRRSVDLDLPGEKLARRNAILENIARIWSGIF